jgi:hypothetical protein
MRITDSSVSLYGASTSVEEHTKAETLKMWVGSTRPDFEGENRSSSLAAPAGQQADILQLSEEGKKALEEKMNPASIYLDNSDDVDMFKLSDEDKSKIYLVQKMIEFLTGKKLKFVVPRKINSEQNNEHGHHANTSGFSLTKTSGGNQIQLALGTARQGWGLEYDLQETHYEKQTMSFAAGGSVKTADGREIKFDLNLNLSREFASSLNLSIRAGDAVKVDPLVVNFGISSASLTNNKYQFDIDADGTDDQISFVGEGSGFLAFDINNDGVINNGSELFGPKSGNGFSDLSEYDSDGNGWIDENDDIYSKLRIWTKDAQGNDQLFALGAKGIGAIYLGSVATSYDLKTSSNESLGSIARSGIFLRENGLAGTIQHVDLTI